MKLSFVRGTVADRSEVVADPLEARHADFFLRPGMFRGDVNVQPVDAVMARAKVREAWISACPFFFPARPRVIDQPVFAVIIVRSEEWERAAWDMPQAKSRRIERRVFRLGHPPSRPISHQP